ncbi:N-acetylglucosamine/diacetylchitobiose ABC transporter substrate-binding protein [Kitasatospora atroaurantiaca]|uniref:N-acetylglucosamine transport system substrate-binding protein n=1 Tax=Kitasatospora atroaurantiaca TaxID=285545 RepID=A0A561EP09_9ACTN|nr:N-acetylglucosamine/diacetylchitobiose ABC transporter substrate-binding protein [Kitasatospora atroaurantiaca]TWE17354.1 N-acetylglucosamine transport system substrate-binding protein [Kitasatospora atroaurantiaca]
MGSATEYNRRDIFKRAAGIAVLAAGGGSLLAACAGGTGSSNDKGGKSGATNLSDPKNPFGVKDGDGLEVFIFDGGYGNEYAKAFEAIYSKSYPGAKVNHTADKDVTGKLQPRFNAGSPPDVIDDSGAHKIALDVLADSNQLTDLAPLLDAPYIDDPSKKIRDVLMPGTIESGTVKGKLVNLSYVYTVFGFWYSNKLFKEHGWTAPKTWVEFIALCEKIKAAGIAPLAHQGKYPYYINVVMMDMIAKQGGLDLMKRIDSLDAAAWDEPAVKTAVEAFYQVVDKDFLLPGTNGMTHTESQTAWNQYKAAFIPSGSWIENEQLATTPADFDMAFLPMPSLAGDKLPFEAIRAGAGEPFIVPSKAKNVAGGLEFLRMMLTKEASGKFAQTANSLTCLKDGVGPEVKLKPGTASTVVALKAAGANTFNFQYPNTASKFDEDLQNASGELMAKRITPAEWIKRAKDSAAKNKTA